MGVNKCQHFLYDETISSDCEQEKPALCTYATRGEKYHPLVSDNFWLSMVPVKGELALA
jgi:hypothetical protein